MRIDFVSLLRSPRSLAPLSCEIFESTSDGPYERVVSGRLVAGDEEYPIIEGVPRLLLGELMTNLLRRYPRFMQRFGSRFSSALRTSEGDAASCGSLEMRTQDSFGYQWNEFSDFYAQEWEQNFWMYVGQNLQQADFKDKLVLDVGCGFGRHLFFAAKHGARTAIGVDISTAVDAAAYNVRSLPNALVVQADIHQLPFGASFDLIYSIGVLQHVRAPIRAVAAISRRLQENGKFFAWAYGPRPWAYHAVVDTLRKATTRLSPRALYWVSYALAAPSYAIFALPRKMLEACQLGALGAKIPFSHYARYPFRVSHADWFDRLSAPKTEYFSENDCNAMLIDAGLQRVSVRPRAGGGWLLFGERARDVGL